MAGVGVAASPRRPPRRACRAHRPRPAGGARAWLSAGGVMTCRWDGPALTPRGSPCSSSIRSPAAAGLDGPGLSRRLVNGGSGVTSWGRATTSAPSQPRLRRAGPTYSVWRAETDRCRSWRPPQPPMLVLGGHEHRPSDRVSGGTTAQRLADSLFLPLLVLASSQQSLRHRLDQAHEAARAARGGPDALGRRRDRCGVPHRRPPRVLGALGLVLPGALGVAPLLTPLAAVGLALTMIGGIVTHVRMGETDRLAVPIVLLRPHLVRRPRALRRAQPGMTMSSHFAVEVNAEVQAARGVDARHL